MSKPKSPSAVQKKKRLAQLREAQRRRRERLKEDSKFFVQIILSKEILARLQNIITESGETMQQAIGRLVESSLPPPATAFDGIENEIEPDRVSSESFSSTLDSFPVSEEPVGDYSSRSPDEEIHHSSARITTNDPVTDGKNGDHDSVPAKAGQLDLFA